MIQTLTNHYAFQNRLPRVVQLMRLASGPEPLECLLSAIDYKLYLERLVAPVVDGIVLLLDSLPNSLLNQLFS